MTRFPYDQFAKDYLDELLKTLGRVQTSKSVPAEIRQIDVYFVPDPQVSEEDRAKLGLLGRCATKSGLFEPFRNAATVGEIRSCTTKLHYTIDELERNEKSNNSHIRENELPFLWILSPTVSPRVLNGFRTYSEEEWGKGVYFFGDFWRGAIVAIHHLPRNEDTLWLRLLGRGQVYKQAVAELESLPKDNLLGAKAIDLLLNLKATLELKKKPNKEDREVVMRLSPIYQQQLVSVEQKGREEGIQEGLRRERRTSVENILQARFGSLDEELRAIVESLLTLPPEELIPLLLQLSREELLARFSQG